MLKVLERAGHRLHWRLERASGQGERGGTDPRERNAPLSTVYIVGFHCLFTGSSIFCLLLRIFKIKCRALNIGPIRHR